MANIELLICGFGGQGIVLAGQVMVTAAMISGKEVTYMPTYGADVRGGSSHVSVVMADRYIASPYVTKPSDAIIMSRPGLDKFEDTLMTGARLIVNSSIIDRKVIRKDLNVFYVPTVEIASEVGDPRVVTMVAMGSYIAAADTLKMEAVKEALSQVLPPERNKLIDINCRALERGATFYQEHRHTVGQ